MTVPPKLTIERYVAHSARGSPAQHGRDGVGSAIIIRDKKTPTQDTASSRASPGTPPLPPARPRCVCANAKTGVGRELAP